MGWVLRNIFKSPANHMHMNIDVSFEGENGVSSIQPSTIFIRIPIPFFMISVPILFDKVMHEFTPPYFRILFPLQKNEKIGLTPETPPLFVRKLRNKNTRNLKAVFRITNPNKNILNTFLLLPIKWQIIKKIRLHQPGYKWPIIKMPAAGKP